MASVPSQDEAFIRFSDKPTRADTSLSRFRRRLTFAQLPGRSQVLETTEAVPEQREDSREWERSERAASAWASSEITRLLFEGNVHPENYGLIEYRDGFFDAIFLKPRPADKQELIRRAERTLTVNFQKPTGISSLTSLFDKEALRIKQDVLQVITTRDGIKLAKSFLAVFIAYILCLVPSIRDWLGRYSYILVVSTIVNHPGRTAGAQIDGAVLTILGTAAGLGWGAFALWLSTCTPAAADQYGAILAVFLAVNMATVATLRSYFIRFYQFVMCSGMAVIYTCLSDVSESTVRWPKLFNYGIPWVLGQAICLLINIIIWPDAGSRPLAVAWHNNFESLLVGLSPITHRILESNRRDIRMPWTRRVPRVASLDDASLRHSSTCLSLTEILSSNSPSPRSTPRMLWTSGISYRAWFEGSWP
jgi:hypothetical protein